MKLDANDPRAIEAAAALLAAGELLAFPTETVYGLGARADDDAAVAKIFAAKGRPPSHPLIVHVADIAAAQRFAGRWPAMAQRLAERFWPGPVSLVVPRAAGIADAAAGGAPTMDKSHWSARIAQGTDVLHKHAIEGYTGPNGGIMPPKGGNPALSDDQVKATVEWMVAQSK